MAAPCGKLPGASFEGFRVAGPLFVVVSRNSCEGFRAAAGSCGTSSNFVLWDLNEGNCRRKNFGNCCLAEDPGNLWENPHAETTNLFFFQRGLGGLRRVGCWGLEVFFSPNSVVTLGVLTVMVKGRGG